MKEFERIIGYEAIKRELIQISDALANSAVYQRLGTTPPRGLLLHGEPGVGKTLMATAVIEASGRKAFICRKDKPNGDFVKAIKQTFKDAADAAPSIVFLDDMDKFANGDERHPDAEEYVTVQSCIDSVKDKDVFVLATANNLRPLPNSLLRAGRFDRIIEVDNPRGDDAVNIIAHYMKQKNFVGDIDVHSIARIMDGHSCAELETVINEAGLYAGFERSEVITMEHFMRACLHTIHNVPIDALNITEFEADLNDPGNEITRVVYHEAGHAVISEVLNPGSVSLISAHSRNGGSSGFTMYKRSGANDVTGLRGLIIGALGGMAALEQKFGIVDTGTSRDLKQAFRIAWDLITENCVSGFHLHSNGYDDSAELTAKQEQAAAAEVERLYRKTKEILSRNYKLLDAIAKELSVKGILTFSDIQRIRSECNIATVHI